MSLERLKTLVQTDLESVNHLIFKKIEGISQLSDALAHHILDGGGKRIRPLLVLISSRACGYEGLSHIALAALIECFHTATLLHDDVVDNAVLRRGKETANMIWGNKASILVGDFLFTQTLGLMMEVDHTKIQKLLANTAYEISKGEIKQLAQRYKTDFELQDYLDVIRSKTALLFATSSTIGPLLKEAPAHFEKAFYNYGLHLGNTFQLIDDTLDYCADPKKIGKDTGNDLADGKATLPLLHVLKHGNALQKQLVTDSIQSGSCHRFNDILDAIEVTGGIEYTRAMAKREKDKAQAAIANIPDSSYKKALLELAEFALERDY